MITLFSNATPAVLLPLTYNGYVLNTMSTVESTPVGTRVTAVAPSSAIDYISENRQWADGIEVYGITKVSRIFQVNGFVYGSSRGDLKDRIKALAHAFDAAHIGYNNDDPFLPLTFDVPSANATDYPSGVASSKYFCLPIRMPEPLENNAQGFSARFQIPLLLKDPRRYLQTAVTLSGAGTLANSKADYHSYPTITFTMSGAGSATFIVGNTSTRQGVTSITFDLSGRSNGQAITLDFEHRRVLVNGTVTQGIYVSGSWFDAEPGNNVITYTNTTNIGTRTMTVYPAFSY